MGVNICIFFPFRCFAAHVPFQRRLQEKWTFRGRVKAFARRTDGILPNHRDLTKVAEVFLSCHAGRAQQPLDNRNRDFRITGNHKRARETFFLHHDMARFSPDHDKARSLENLDKGLIMDRGQLWHRTSCSSMMNGSGTVISCSLRFMGIGRVLFGERTIPQSLSTLSRVPLRMQLVMKRPTASSRFLSAFSCVSPCE